MQIQVLVCLFVVAMVMPLHLTTFTEIVWLDLFSLFVCMCACVHMCMHVFLFIAWL